MKASRPGSAGTACTPAGRQSSRDLPARSVCVPSAFATWTVLAVSQPLVRRVRTQASRVAFWPSGDVSAAHTPLRLPSWKVADSKRSSTRTFGVPYHHTGLVQLSAP